MSTPETLPQVLVEQTTRWPDEVWQRKKDRGIWQRYTWSEVLDHVRTLALGLASLGLQRGETVATAGENEPEHYWAEFAALSMGGKCVAMYPDLTPDEMHYLVTDSDAVYIVAEDQEQVDKVLEILEKTPQIRAVIYWDDKGMWSYDCPVLKTFKEVQELGRRYGEAHPGLFEASVAAGKSSDIAVLSYTSGTTGLPKGVVTTHANLLDNASRLMSGLDFTPRCEYLSYIPLAWATEQYFGITLGTIVPMTVNFPEEPEEVLGNIREIAVETLLFGPRQWESLASTVQARMLDTGKIRRWLYDLGLKIGRDVNVSRLEGRKPPLLSRVLYPVADIGMLKPLRDKLGLVRAKVALCGGSAMAPDLFRLFHAMGVSLRNGYGASEFGMFTCHQGETYNLETVGHWMTGDPRWGAPLEWRVSQDGELQVKGGSGFNGYYKKPEKSAEKFVGDWFCTGDAVSVTNRGELVFLERVDDMRELSTGHKYPPQFIETRLRFSPFIKDVMIVGDRRHPCVAALINIDPEVVGRWAEDRRIGYSTFTDLSQKAEIRARIRQEIARINELLPVPSRVYRFANFPKELDPDEGELTRTRKLRREFLDERYKDIIAGMYDAAGEVECEIPVTYQDGRRGMLKATVIINDAGTPDPARQERSGVTTVVKPERGAPWPTSSTTSSTAP